MIFHSSTFDPVEFGDRDPSIKHKRIAWSLACLGCFIVGILAGAPGDASKGTVREVEVEVIREVEVKVDREVIKEVEVPGDMPSECQSVVDLTLEASAYDATISSQVSKLTSALQEGQTATVLADYPAIVVAQDKGNLAKITINTAIVEKAEVLESLGNQTVLCDQALVN